MKRRIALWAIFGLTVCGGCRMCACTYDFTGAVYDEGYQYGFTERRGSAFTAYGATPPEIPADESDVPEPTLAPIPDRLSTPSPALSQPGA